MGYKILLVDDERDIVEMVTLRLKVNGYEVITAFDGQDGLEKAQKEKPDLILLDLMLPKLDGYKVCKILKSNEKFKHIPIILFSVRSQELDIKIGKHVGADGYIIKPFEPPLLLNTIKDLLEKSKK